MGIIAKGAWLAAAAALLVSSAPFQTTVSGYIGGVVVDASTGLQIVGARVRVQSGQDDALFTYSDAQGFFRFATLEIKTYEVDASYPGYMSPRNAPGTNRGTTVALGTFRPSAQIRLELRRYGVIVGKVTDPVGVPVEGAAVAALQSFPAGERGHVNCGLSSVDGGSEYLGQLCVRTDDVGEYRLAPLAAGAYYVVTGNEPTPAPRGEGVSGLTRDPSERTTLYPRALKPSEAAPVEVTEGKEARADIQIVRQGGVSVSGRVLGLITEEAAGLHVGVSAVPLSGVARSWSSDDMSGDRFRATDLLPGKYLFEAFQYDWSDSHDANTFASARRTVEVGTADLDGVDLTLLPATDLEGAVVFENGCPAVPMWVMLRGDFARDFYAGAGGRFALRRLLPGNYKVFVKPEIPSNVLAISAKLGETEVITDGFEVTPNTKGPLRIAMSCGRR